ncbi:54S ribosomal protein L20, mitochondrial [Trichoderma asperellum]|uniref:54S ribosomal protein L20, mitochondrial n=1 Tax=Trichoderma asperellum TaxID=101201 RepID=A0A6V8QXC0_TRIAP|nr:54S ribosomal protein L20, mitochondrial [Trichoderma asperellum]
MDLRTLFVRPASQLLSPLRLLASTKHSSAAPLPLIPSRGHKTTTRTKRALKIAPHDSFLPSRTSAAAADSIIYNPPSSEASPEHTPFIFLPRNDPRRQAILRLRSNSGGDPTAYDSSSITAESDLPPEMRYKRRQPKYNLTKEHIEEMRRLRSEDPLTWSVQKLARKFECSTVFVQMAAPAPPEHLQWLKAKMDRKMERWGPKRTQAREDRKRRAEMLYRGEL